MSLEKTIERVLAADSIVAALDAGRRLRREVGRGRPGATARLLLAHCGEDADALAQLLLVRALARIEGPVADDALVAMLGESDPGTRQHAAWALAERPPVAAALPDLLGLAAGGGFDTMLAQLAIEGWGGHLPRALFGHLSDAVDAAEDPSCRARLVETLTLVPGAAAQETLHRLSRDRQQPAAVRAAAIRGFDPRFAPPTAALAAALASADAGLRLAAVEALGDLAARRDPRAGDLLTAVAAAGDDPRLTAAAGLALAEPAAGEPGAGGLRVAQVVLQGRVDAGLDGAGGGDSGGLATLLVNLGRALGERPEIDHVFTVARGFGGAGVPETYGRLEEPMGAGATLARVPFGPEGDLGVAAMWRHRLQIERGLERLLRRLGKLDGIHLRFADAGTLAASRVARRRKIPLFFSLAPDPHSVIRAAEAAGTLNRRGFAPADRREHLLFRAELVEGLVRDARRLALFPRPDLERDLEELLDVDVAADPHRFRTVPEGIDTRLPARAEREVRTPSRGLDRRRRGPRAPVLEELERRVDRLGGGRRGLPLLVGLGRLHPVKGFHRLAQAWAGDPRLRRSFNLLLVGGDLEQPSEIETRVLERIEDALGEPPEACDGLLLLGRRSNRDAARLLAAARWGLGTRVAAGGVFVCASDKEEFGLAILEAMAAGLAVVAPDSGGPATYVSDGDNGFLARTTSIPRLRAAIHRAAAAATCGRRTELARGLVRERFTVDAMAAALARMYHEARGADRILESAA